LEQAEKACQEALQIFRQLAARNPEVYQPDVAMTLHNLGNLYYVTQRLEQAEKAYQEALQIFRPFAQKCPDAYNGNLAMCLNNMALFYDSIGDSARAQSCRRDAEDVLKAQK
jgi:tetratricopeptide (TPR) repeat protein